MPRRTKSVASASRKKAQQRRDRKAHLKWVLIKCDDGVTRRYLVRKDSRDPRHKKETLITRRVWLDSPDGYRLGSNPSPSPGGGQRHYKRRFYLNPLREERTRENYATAINSKKRIAKALGGDKALVESLGFNPPNGPVPDSAAHRLRVTSVSERGTGGRFKIPYKDGDGEKRRLQDAKQKLYEQTLLRENNQATGIAMHAALQHRMVMDRRAASRKPPKKDT